MHDVEADISYRATGRRRCIIVAGMHRSGTSALTRVINLLGAQIDYPLLDPSFDNEKGFWEPREVVSIHEELLQDIGLSHDSYTYITEEQLRSDAAHFAIDRLVAFMEKAFDDRKRLVVLKDPRICRLIPLWQTVLARTGFEPAYVLPIRHPIEVAQSLRRRNGFHLNKSLLMWLGHVLVAERMTRGSARSIVSYNDLMSDWRRVAAQIAADLDLAWPRGITTVSSEIDDFLDSGLRHHAIDEAECPTDLPWVAEAWKVILDLMRDPRSGSAVLDNIASELRRAEAAFDPLERAMVVSIADRDALIRLRDDELAHVRHAERVLIADLEAARMEAEAYGKDASETRTRLSELQREYDSLKLDIETATLAHVHTQEELLETRAACETMSTQILAAQTQIVELNTAITEANRDKAAYKDVIAELEARNGQMISLTEDLAAARAEITVCGAALERADVEQSQLRLQHHIAEVRLSGYAGLHTVAIAHPEFRKSHLASLDGMKKIIAWLRSAIGLFPHHNRTGEVERAITFIKEQNAFDVRWYLAQYPDVAREGVDPLRHYCTHGWREGRNPSAKFDTLFYLGSYPDVVADGINPLVHWLRFGSVEGRRACPATLALSSRIAQREDNLAVLNAKVPTAPHVLSDERAVIATSGLFDETYYCLRNPDVARSGCDPLVHFCEHGWREGRSPCAGFSVSYYLEHNPDVAAADSNPFAHWILYGRNEGRPSAADSNEDEWGINGEAFNPSMIFVSHEASRTGAPKVLLSMLKWLKANTDIEFGIIVGADGPLRNEFRALAPCLFMDAYPQDVLPRKLRAFCGVNVQVVYLNTIVASVYGTYLTFLNAKFITHVHEMESLFVLYEDAFRKLRTFCQDFIAVSQGSVEAIKKRTATDDVRITLLPPFIDRFDSSISQQVPSDADGVPVIYACGTLESRKAPDIFCDVAEVLLTEGVSDFRMKWIGPKADVDLAAEIARRGLEEHVQWLGAQKQPQSFFQHGAMFVLTSREDAFPLVCLEAAEQGLPVICFDGRAGSMHSFVGDDAGIVVPYLDVHAMAEAIKALLCDERRRRALSDRARAKVVERHLTGTACKEILSLLPPLVQSNATDVFEAYKEQIDRAEIISFDIFDTLITRRLSNPNTVFDIIEHRHSAKQTLPVGLLDMRMQVAGAVLGKHRGQRDDVSIDDIYADMPLFREADIEKATEIEMVEPHPLGVRLYDYARAAGKHVVIVSDMYLDEATIEAMLAAGGIESWDRLFLSSKLGLKKDTGRLFPLVVEYAASRGVSAQQILHIGDNWEGDVYKAKAAGLKAIRFMPLYETEHRKFPIPTDKVQKLSQIGRIWNDFTTQASRLWSERNPHLADDVHMKLGFELTGPLAGMMAMYVRAQADRTGARKIVFMARDGRIIMKAFEALYQHEILTGKYEPIYAHLSRAVVVPATLKNPLSSSDLYFLIEGLHLAQEPIRYFLEKAGLDTSSADVVRKVKTYFPGLNTIPHWNDLLALTSLLKDLSDDIYAANAPMRDRFAAYLQQKRIDDGSRTIVVDVGWLLNIQSRFHQFCSDMGINEEVFGVYVGSRERVDKSVPHASLLFDGGDPRNFADLIEENTTLFEVLFSAPEPSATTLVYGADGEVEVALKPLSMPRSKEFIVAQKLHFGAEAYFEELASALKTFMPERISRDFFAAAFEALVFSTDADVHREFGAFEVMLGGQHDLRARQNLLRGTTPAQVATAPRSEYFLPMHIASANSSSGRKVAIVTSAGLDNGSTRYRGVHFGQSLAALGERATLFHAATDIELFERETADCDVVVFQRCFREQGQVGAMFDLARRRGQRCVMEIDDLVFPEFIPVIGSVVGGEWNRSEAEFVASAYEKMMCSMDGAIVSTEAIRAYIADRWNFPTAVYRNRVSSVMSRVIDPREPLRMVFASGTYSHKEDFLIAVDALRKILNEHPQARLSLLGATQVPDYFLGLPNVTSYPLLPYAEMLDLICRHNLMIVPLADNIFNHAKSNVKFIECAACAVPVLSSDVSEYTFAIRDRDNGFIARTELDWHLKLDALARDRSPLTTVGLNAQSFVKQNYQCDTVDADTASALRQVLFGDMV